MITTLFFVSLLVICGMICFKFFQLRVRKIHFLNNLFFRGDTLIHIWVEKAITLYNLLRKIANLFFFDFLPSYAYDLLARMKDYIAKRYSVAGDQFRGRRTLRAGGPVSFFLERLAEEKSDISRKEA